MLIDKIIEEITGLDRPIVNSHLADLSQMTPGDLKYFNTAWKTIDSKRRQEIITRLVELAMDNVELNFDLIFKSCINDPDDEVKAMAIEGLWENEDPSLVPQFIRLLNTEISEKVQASAAMALGRFALMAELGSISPRYGDSIGEALLAAINDTNRTIEVRRRALEAIATLSAEEVNKTIKNAYASRDDRMMVGAIYAMGRNCNPRWMPILLKELDNHDAEIRYEAVSACGEMGTEEIVAHLIPLVGDPDTDVRLAAVEALGKIGGNEAKKYLHEHANDTDEAIREAIAQALAAIASQDDMSLFQS
ncbi:MAG: HEAT repeat domain-containing protein [Dehalococcoidales bacterium]|nr:HEAT repeat domain-containing protein [Dehalococcoidales bacterium]